MVEVLCEDDVVDSRRFIRDIMGRRRFLSHEEETMLVNKMRDDKCEVSRSELIQRYMPMIYAEASRLYFPAADSVTFEDLFQEGTMGFMAAMMRFDPTMGIRLSTYVMPQVRSMMLKFKRDTDGPCRMYTTKGAANLYSRWSHVREDLANSVPIADICANYNVCERDINRVKFIRESGSHYPAGVDGCGVHAYNDDVLDKSVEVLIDDVDPHKSLLIAHARNVDTTISKFMDTLDPREKDILENRILADEPKRLRELGETHGISGARVDQIERRIRNKLKTQLEADGITADDVEWY